MIVRRPDSRASDTSLQSGVSLGAIPIVRFVSSIFGQDAVDESTAIENTSAAEDTNTVEDSDIDSVEFNLVVMLAVVQDVWEAFDHDHLQQQQQKDETAESRLLREFGVDTTRSEATSDMHVQHSTS
ncbi:hypothetical protein GGH20_002437 [Coemansia sp. RSA 1937]|nr:hypothetical protein GGH20_002437 [Coemansia sp. RSA 1937]